MVMWDRSVGPIMSKTRARLIAMGLIVGTFTVIGVGLGLTGYFAISTLTGGSGGGQAASMVSAVIGALLIFVGAIVVLFLGPIAAGVSGLTAGLVVPDMKEGALVGGVGSFVGFYPMVILAVVIMMMALGGGGGGAASTAGGGETATTMSGGGDSVFELTQFLGAALIAGVPTGVVGAATGALGSKL